VATVAGGGQPNSPQFWQAMWDMAFPGDGLHPWMNARWDGHCRACGKPYQAGDLIRFYDGEGGYLAECCGVDGAW
jgi:hypothetical protein